MNITQAVERACQESTLLDALTFICIWEAERIVKQARENIQWETCFRVSLKAVIEKYPVKSEVIDGKGKRNLR